MLATSALVAVLGAGSATAASANYTWNGTTTNSPTVVGGSGTWYANNSSYTNWVYNSSSSVAWASGNNATFSGTGGTVTISGGPVGVHFLFFTANNYILGSSSAESILVSDAPSNISVSTGVTATIAASISDSGGGIGIIGGGTLVLTGNNTYTGNTYIVSGTVVAGSNSAFGSTAGGTTISTGGGVQIADGVTLAENFTIAGNSTLTVLSGTGTVTGNVTLSADSRLNTVAKMIISGTVSGNYTVYKNVGAGELVFSGNNSASSTNLNIATGTLTITDQTNLTGGTLTLNGGSLKITGSDVTIAKNIAFSSASRILNDNTVTLSGTRSGSGALTKGGSGKLILTGTGGTGSTTVQAGILSIADATKLGTGGITLGGGGLEVTGTNAVIDRTISLSMDGALNATNSATFSGVISGTRKLTTGGGGTVTLTGANTYSGGTSIGAGTLSVSTNGALGAASGSLSFSGGTLATTADISSSRSVDVSSIGGEISTAQGTSLILSGALTGTGALAKSGNGTLALTGNGSGFSGTTTVSTGTLLLDGGSLGGSMVVASGATLAANGGGSFNGTSLVLQSGAITNVTLGAPNSTAIFRAGSLTVDGTLNIAATTGYGVGVYRIFSSTSALTDNGLTLGSVPSTGGTPQLVIGTNTVDVVLADASLLYWSAGSGTTRGGSGTWTSSSATWLNGDDTRLAWGGQVGVFDGTAGTVSVVGTQNFVTLEFLTSGYAVNAGAGGKLDLGTGGTVWAEGADVTATISTEITGSGALTKVGAGTIVLSGQNSYQGGTVITAGTLQIAALGALGSGNVSFGGGTLAVTQNLTTSRNFTFGTGGGTLNIADGTTTELAGTVDGAGAFTKTGTGTVTLSGTASGLTGALTVDQGTLVLSGTGVPVNASSVTVNGTLNISAITAAAAELQTLSGSQSGQIVLGAKTLKLNQGTDATFAGVISGAGGLEFGGAGILTLTGANTYTGTSVVSNGILVAGSSGALGTSAGGTTVAAGATLRLSNGVTIADALSIAGSGTSSSGALSVTSGSATINGNVALSAASSVYVADSASLTLSGMLSGAFNLTRNFGNGELVLSGNNSTNSTNLNIQVGTLTIANASNLTTGTLTLNMGNTGVGGLKVTDDNVTIAKNITLGASGGIIRNDNTLTLSGNITGGVSSNASRVISFTKVGSGKLILTGTNTYTSSTGALGATMISGGILSITSGANIGSTTIAGTVILNGGGLEVTGTNVTLTNNVLLNSNGAITATNSATFSGVISGSRTLTTGGGGFLTLSGVNTYTGGTTIGTGTLAVNADSALGAAAGGITFAGGTLQTGLDVTSSRNVAVGGSGGTLAVGANTTLALTGVLSGTGALAKTGQGDLVLSGNSSGFAGTTTVSAGSLALAAGSTLGGSMVVASGGTLTSSGGSFNGTSLVLQSGAITSVTLGAPNTTAYFTAGTLTVDGTLDITASTGYGSGVYRIFASTNALTDNGLTLGSVPSTGGSPQLVVGTNTVDVVMADTTLLYWSAGTGTTRGGAGTWTSSSTTWLNGDDVRLAWGGQTGIFDGTSGNVTVVGTQAFTTLEFLTSGYELQAGAGGKLDLGTGGTVWAEGAATSATISTEITGTGALTKVGAGTIVLAGQNTYQGGTVINAGTLQIGDVGALGSGNVSFGGGTLAVTQDLTTSRTFTFGTGGGTVNVAGDTTTEFAGSVNGAGSFTKTGTGTLLVSGFFSGFTGALTVDQGTLALSYVGVPVNASSVTVNGTLDISAITASVAQLHTLSGSQSGAIVLGSKGLKLNQGTDATFAGVISGSGGLEFGGSGVLTLTGASTYGGETTISVGTLIAGSSGALGSAAGGTTISSGATLQLADGITIADALTMSGSGVSNSGALVVNTGSVTVSGNVTLGASASVTVADDASLTLSGTLAGPYSLTRSLGNGELVLSGNNSTAQTDLNIQVGTLTIANASNLTAGTLRLNMGNTGVGGLKVTGSNVTIAKDIVLGASGGRVINDNTLTLSGNITGGVSSNLSSVISFTKAGSGKLILSGSNSYTSSTSASGGTQVLGGTLSISNGTNIGSGAIVLAGGGLEVTGGDASIDRAILLRANATLAATGFTSFDGAITESGTRSLTTGGGGTIALNGVNSYSGGTTIGAGRVTITADTALGAAAGGITFAGGTLYTMASITTSRNVTVGTDGGTFRTDGGTVLTLTGTLSGTGALTKSDGGVLKLMGNNSGFGGTITVADGGLEIASGATLGGSLVVAGGTLTGGGGSTSLTSLVLQEGATTSVTLRSTNPNAIFSADDLTVAGTLNITAGPGYGVGVYRIFASTNALTDNGLTLGNVPSGNAIPQLQIGTNTVNVLVADATLQFWSPGGGTTQGGSGTWSSGASSWLNAEDVRMSWGGQMAVFGGEAGTVTVFGTQAFSTLEFTTSGYVIQAGQGGELDLGTGGTVWAEGADTTATISTDITGSGALTKVGAGTIILSGANSYQGGTVIAAGTLQVAADAALGGGNLTLDGGTLAVTQDMTTARTIFVDAGGGTLNIATDTTTTVNNDISGTGSFTKAGAGTLALEGSLSGFTGGLIVQQGTLALSGGAIPVNASSVTVNARLDISGISLGTPLVKNLSGSADGRIELGSNTLGVSQTGTSTFAGVISGTGSLRTSGTGTLILTGTNTYTGGTRVASGTLQIGDGGTTGSIIGTTIVDSGASLVFNRSDTYTFAGTISGDGAVSFKGGGTVLFSNPNSYTGAVAVDDSSLVLANGSSSGATYEVNSGSTISGNGTIGGLVVNDGGVAAPGNSPGTITVAGTVTFNNGSTYRVDVTPSGQHDLIIATGAVTINSGSSVEVVAVPGIYAVNSSYAILTGASVTGTFGSVTSDYAFLTPTLSYDAQNVFLTLVYDNPNIRFGSYAQTSNQLATADAAQALGLGNPVFDAVVQLSSAAVPGALNALSGEAYASTSSLMQQQSVYVREAVGARLRQSLSAPDAQPLAYAAKAAGPATASLGGGLTPTLWAQGYGGWGETYGNGNAATISNTIGGFLIGADVALTPNARAGVFGGFSQSQFDVTDRSSTGSMDNYDIGLYGAAQFGALALRGGLSYTWHDVSMNRSVLFPGVSQSLKSGYAAGTTQAFGELGYDVPVGAYAFEPFVGLAYVATSGGSLTETGGTAGLGVDVDAFNTLYTTLGIRAATSFQVMGRTLTPNMTLGWQHAFGDTTPNAIMLFQGGTTPFQVSGAPIAEDAILLGAGLSYALSDVAALAVNYTGQLASTASQNAFTAQFSLKF